MALKFVVKHFKKVGIETYGDYEKEQRKIKIKRLGRKAWGVIKTTGAGLNKMANSKGKKRKGGRGYLEQVYNNFYK